MTEREPYDADLAAWVAARAADPTASDTSVEGSRAHSRATNARATELVADRIRVGRERAIEIPTATGPVPARAFYPDTETPGAIIAYFHGGGWVIGDLDTHAQYAARLALACSAVVVSVGYRLAPEHRFPVAYEDCLAATLWLHRNLDEFLPDVAEPRLAVAGDSAGGQLAASVAIACRDRSVPLTAQLLLYPVTDTEGRYASPILNARYPSREQNAEGYGLTLDGMRDFVDHYAEGGFADVRMSPMHADDLTGVAPAVVHTAGYDVLRDEGDAYAARLREAGVPLTHRRWPTLGHSFFGLGGVGPALEQAAATAADDLAARLHPGR